MRHNAYLKPGSFYWVQPNYDVDLTPPGFEGREFDEDFYDAQRAHWSQKAQPARFNGWGKDGEEQWNFIGSEDPDPGDHWWSVVWIGDEIVEKEAA